MKHLLICREYPPASYPVGGIGTYAGNITSLLAAAGETVHVIAQRWSGASSPTEEFVDGRLIVHRLYMEPGRGRTSDRESRALFASDFPPQAFAWRAALLAERLIEEEGIDVVESQDWEAPLYFLQRRRAEGKGPKARPPLLVHLHSPTEMIVAANHWDSSRPDHVVAATLEDYSIRAADGWVSPSRFMAREVATRYEIPESDIEVIPYPLSARYQAIRSPEVWRSGTILFVGRMERRKGLLEWVEASVTVAKRHPTVRFEMVGPDSSLSTGSTMRHEAQRLVPADLADRFTFHPEMASSQVASLLAQARIAVVPSLWDNFPNTCLEAMQSGLPVLTTTNGGMAEVVTNDETGWLAAEADVVDLADALERALACGPERLAAMGASAAKAVRRICDPDRVLDAHREHRRSLVANGSSVSSLPIPPAAGANKGFVPSHHRAGLRALLSLPPRRQLAVGRDILGRVGRLRIWSERSAQDLIDVGTVTTDRGKRRDERHPPTLP